MAAPYRLATKQQPAAAFTCNWERTAYDLATAWTGDWDRQSKLTARQFQTAEASQARQQHTQAHQAACRLPSRTSSCA